MTQRIITILILGGLLSACDQNKEKQAAKGTEYVLAGESSLSPSQKKEVVAKIGDRLITLEEFESRLNQQSVFARNRHNSPSRKREFLDSLVRFELLAIEAKRKGYDAHPDVLLAQKQAMVKRFTSKELSRLIRMADITKADIEAYYKAHPSEFHRAAQVRAAHILLKSEDQAKALHAKITAEITADPGRARQVFAKYAESESLDMATKKRRGDLQFFGKPGVSNVKRPQNAPLVPSAIANAAFDLKPVGALSPQPLKTPAGWHLVQKTGYRRAMTRTVDEMQNKLRTKLFRRRKTKAMEDYVQNLRKNATIKIHDKVLEKAKAKRSLRPMPRMGPRRLGPRPPGGAR